ncbi:MAG TPA: hypothetical protein VJ723_12670 [Candidatus Angelobacter sp.]|nr:hypothetical protein [Candidatus Angelobacter sp.]
MKKSAHSYPVPPNSVYVWRGFKPASLDYAQFTAFLATVFVPACVQLQPPIGLRAYLPSMVPQANKPAAVPDQTALMFWRTPAAHDEAKVALAERIYSNLHGDVYDMNRSTLQEVPKPLDATSGALQPEQPYYLLDGEADWMQGVVHHLVGARRPDLSANDFLTGAATWAKALRQKPPRGMDAGLVCCGNDYAVAWLHGTANSKALQSAVDPLAKLTQPVLNADAHAITMDAGLWDDWAGLDLATFPCLNFQFPRPRDAKPKKRGK